MACLGIAASSRWRHTAVDVVAIRARIPVVLSLLLGALLPIPLGIWFSAAEYSIIAALTLAAVFWVGDHELAGCAAESSIGAIDAATGRLLGHAVRSLRASAVRVWAWV